MWDANRPVNLKIVIAVSTETECENETLKGVSAWKK